MEMNGHAVDTQWFQGQLSDRRLSQRQLAKRLGLDPAAVSLMLRGKRKMSAAEAAEIASLLGVSVDEVLLHAGSTPTVPVRPSPAPRGVIVAAAPATPKAMAAPVEVARPGAGVIDLPVPMSDGSEARLVLPAGLRLEDAERIAALVRALARP